LKFEKREGDLYIEGVKWGERVLVVIPVYNNLALTVGCIEFLKKNTVWKYEVLVIDNGSTDGTGEWLESMHSRGEIQYVKRNSENWGVAKSWNWGIELARKLGYKWIVFLNNDTEPGEKWMWEMLYVMNSRDKVKVVSAEFVWRVYEQPREIDEGVYIFERGKFLPPGFCFLVDVEVFGEVGVFDESFRVCNYEEADFFRRVQQKGMEIALAGRAYVKHYGTMTTRLIEGISEITEANRRLYEERWGK
jgi:GT2 family glycosyltransferase